MTEFYSVHYQVTHNGFKHVVIGIHASMSLNAVIKAHGMAKAGVPEKIEQGLKYR